MGDGLEHGAIERPKFTTIFFLRFGFNGRADQLVQVLTFARMLVQKLCQTFWVRNQTLPPLLRLMVMPFFVGVHALHCIQLRLQCVSGRQSHAFANKLQLTPPGFVLFRGHRAEKRDGLFEAVIGKFDALELSIREFCQLLSERLQGCHLAFHRTLRWTRQGLVGVNIVFFKGASICHGH